MVKESLQVVWNRRASTYFRVDEASYYLYGSARDYYGNGKGYLAIEFIE